MKRRVSVALALGVSSFGSARAAPPGGSTEEVRVQGAAAGGFSSKASLDAAPREVTDAASLVEPLPGVHVRRLGADDSFATLSIRGTSSTEVAVYLAGVPLTGGADPTLDLATLPLWPGARARVYRSFAPAAIGPGSLGGVLVVDPPGAQTEPRTEVWGAAGSFGALRMRAGDVRELGQGTRVVSALSASRADDDFSYFDPTVQAFRARENAGHAAVNGLVGYYLPVRFGDAAPGHLAVTMLAQARRQELPGTIYLPTPRQRLSSDRELTSLELSFPAAGGAWIARVWGRRDGLRVSDDPRLTLGLAPSRTDDTIAAAGASTGWRGRPDPAVTLDARLDASDERFAPGAWTGAAAPPGASRASAGVAADLEWRATPAFTAGASGRLDAWSDRGADEALAREDARPTGHVGGELRVGPIAFAAHAGALARTPSFVERFGNRGVFKGDPALRPETATTADVGARLAGGGSDVRANAEIVGFATWADDLIVFVPQGAYGGAKAENIGRARIAGLETYAEGRAGGAEMRVAYTYLATENDAACAVGVGLCARPPLLGRPAHDLVGDLAYRLGPARVRYGADVVAGLFTSLTGDVQAPARVLQSAGVRVEPPSLPGFRVALDVRNLFDVRTGTYAGALSPRLPIGDQFEFPLPGRSVLVSARYLR
jgi:hypothetical protein